METNFDFNNLDNEVQVILLLTNHNEINIDRLYNYKLFGLEMKNYVKNCFKNSPIYEKEYDESQDLLMQVKGCEIGDRKYTMVLYSDTPLLKRKTVLEIIEYAKMKSLSVLRLTRGFIFETNYLKTIDKLYAPQLHYFDEEDFIHVFSNKQLGLVNDIIRNRILDYNMKKGVIFMSPETTKVDINANIEAGVIIESNNIIKGKSIIESGSHLLEGNLITDSVIKKNVNVANSIINNSFIEENCTIQPFCKIENNSLLEKNCTLNSFVCVNRAVVKQDTVVESFSNLVGEEK